MTTRFPSGVTNVAQETAVGNMPMPDPAKLQMVFDDFASLDALAWTVVETGAGATQAPIVGPGGLLLLTNTATIGDVNGFSTNIAIFQLNLSKRFFAKARFSMLDPPNQNFVLGFGDTAVGLNPANGAYIQKNAGTVSIVVETAGVAVATSVPNSNGEFSVSAMTVIGIEYDGRGRLSGYINDRKYCSVDVTSIPTSNMLGFFGTMNVNAFANLATLDYLMFAVER